MMVLGLSAVLTEPYEANFPMKYGTRFGVQMQVEGFDPDAVITPGGIIGISPSLENCANYGT